MTETPKQRRERLALEDICRDIASTLKQAMPPGVGFSLILFDFGPEGSMSYMSTANREDFIRMCRELLGLLETGEKGVVIKEPH